MNSSRRSWTFLGDEVKGLVYTLLGDGKSDRILEYPINWALRKLSIPLEKGQWADFAHLRTKPRTLRERIEVALNLHPANVLFIHRDSEGVSQFERAKEIEEAAKVVAGSHVAIVPVRMTEAWFLHEEAAIRRASGNPNGKISLELPLPKDVEGEPDPKNTLRLALLAASELSGRRRKKKDKEFGSMRARVAELVSDFESLQEAASFSRFLSDLINVLSDLGYQCAENWEFLGEGHCSRGSEGRH